MREFAKAIITAPFLQAKIDEYFDQRATAGPGGASPGSGRPVWIVVLLVLAVVAVIAIVVTYWVEILFAGLAVLAFHYRKPISQSVRRMAATWSRTEPEEEGIEKPPTAAQGICGNCHRPSMTLAPFCTHCGSCITAPPPPPPILPPRIEQLVPPVPTEYGVSPEMRASQS